MPSVYMVTPRLVGPGFRVLRRRRTVLVHARTMEEARRRADFDIRQSPAEHLEIRACGWGAWCEDRDGHQCRRAPGGVGLL